MAIGVGGAYFADYMEPDIAAALYSPPEAVVAGSGQPGGNAVRDDGALRVDGSWDYCSGCHHASFFTAGARVEGRPRAVILPPEQVTIRESWNAIGLRLTSSHTVTANPARISENQLFDLENPPLPAIYPISRYPFMAFAQSCFAPAVSGMAIALMEEAEQLLEHKRAKWSVSDEARPRYIENTIRNFVEQWRIRRARFYTALKESWHSLKAGEPVTEEAVARAALDWTAFSYHGAADLMPCLGMDALARDHPLQQMWQDLQTGYQHMSLHSY